MNKLRFPHRFDRWPVHERAHWFDIELERDELVTLFCRTVGIEGESSKSHLTVAEVAEGLKLLEGQPVIEPKHERGESLKIYREVLGLDPTESPHLTGMEIGQFLGEMYDHGEPGLPVAEYTVNCSWSN